MDDLFRKAADDYPLKTGKSDWDKIAPALQSSPVVPVATKRSNRKKRTGLLLLLFISLLTAGGVFVNRIGNKKEVATAEQHLAKNNESNAVTETTGIDEKLNTEKLNAATLKYSSQQKKRDATVLFVDNTTAVKEKRNNSSSPIIEISQTVPTTNRHTVKDDAVAQSNEPGITISNPASSTIAAGNNDIEQKENIVMPGTTNEKPAKLPAQHGFYLGLIAGPAFSEVKSQGLKKPGLDIGIIAGYRFNDKVSVETGLLLTKKNYFSDGKYFSMNKVGPSMAGMEVMSLDGYSNMLEIPVKLNYSLWQKNKSNIFSSGGISSYIITHEKNDYVILFNGAQQNMTGLYKKSSGYFAASMNISIGYEYKIGKSVNIRAEPYLQIPLKGVGIGSMPVMSSGLRIGISKFIH